MTGFANALQQYREALKTWRDSAPPGQRGLCELHMDTLQDIENRYAETNDPNMCRLLVESAKLIHLPGSLGGASGERVREALAQLVREVTPK